MIVWDEDDQCEFDLRNTDERSEEISAIYREQCGHPRTELRRKVTSNGSVQFRMQCLHCGGGPGGPVPKASVRDPDRVPPYDPAIAERREADRRARLRAVDQKHIRLQKAEKARWWQWYGKYLRSTAWLLRRNLVMARAEGVCEGCRERPATQVHHLTYDHVGNEFLWELVAICDRCHERVHAEETEEGRAA